MVGTSNLGSWNSHWVNVQKNRKWLSAATSHFSDAKIFLPRKAQFHWDRVAHFDPGPLLLPGPEKVPNSWFIPATTVLQNVFVDQSGETLNTNLDFQEMVERKTHTWKNPLNFEATAYDLSLSLLMANWLTNSQCSIVKPSHIYIE